MKQRIVVKIGSSSLTTGEGIIDREKISFFVTELVAIQQSGFQVLLVTSAAVAAGFKHIGYPKRPTAVHEKQAAAAVGQALLMQAYNEAFSRYDCTVAQILLTRSDFSNRKRMHNATMTIEELLKQKTIPIINENDTVAIDELKFGDNDALSALVANLVKAHKLLIITDMDGLYTEDPRKNANAQRINRVEQITADIFRIAGDAGTAMGTGGMRSKIEAARIAMRGGVPVFIGQALEHGDLDLAIQGSGKGTYFETGQHTLSMKKQWLGFHSLPLGTIVVDHGAESALLSRGRSLLPAGVTEVEGDFHPGDVIEVHNPEHLLIGRGVVNYSTWQLRAVAGLSSIEVKKRVDVHRLEVIHRDEWITLAP